MRFKKLVETILTEDIESMKKYYPNISDEAFQSYVELDPTYKEGSTQAGKYAKWILGLANKGKLDNIGHVKDVLSRFDEEKNNLKEKDIMKYKSVDEVEAMLNDENSYKALSDRQRLRQTQKAVHNTDLDQDAERLFNGKDWEVWTPNTYAASCKLGQGTSWCTASTETDSYFNSYHEDGDLFININKKTGEKYQFHFESKSFMDVNDAPIDLLEFMLHNADLYYELYNGMCDLDAKIAFLGGNPNGEVYYTSPEEFENLSDVCDLIHHIEVAEGVTRIPSWEFTHCKNLLTVKLPSTLVEIGDCAFSMCRQLHSINIPDGVTDLGFNTFDYTSIESITIPDTIKVLQDNIFRHCGKLKDVHLGMGLTTIEDNAFEGCSSLKSISLPNGIKSIGSYAFAHCTNLQSFNIPRSAQSLGVCPLADCRNLESVTIPNHIDGDDLGIDFYKTKLTIRESLPMRFALTEDIAAVRKNYPKISDEDFDRLIKLDPTYREGSNSVGTYGKWILNLFNKGNLDNEGHVFDILTRFEENKKNLKNKDIGKFKTLEELDDYLNDEDNYKSLSNRQVTRQNQNARRNADLGNEAEKVFDGSKWEVWIPKTYAASCKLGQGSSWCTASTSSDYYYNYYTRQGNLFININKHDSEDKYQFHFETGSFMDIDDRPITLTDFLSDSANAELHDFYYPIIAKSIGVEIGGADYDLVLDFNGGAFARVLDYWEENYANRDSVGTDFIRQLLTGDGYDLFYYDGMMTIRDSNDLPYASNAVREELKRLGLEIDDLWAIVDEEIEDEEGNTIPYADEILDAVDQATMDAVIVGTEDEAMSDIEKAMTREDGEGYIFTVDQGNLILSASPETLVDAYLEMSEGELPDILRDDSSIAADILVERWASTFRCYEPQYGWNGFSDDAFNEALADRLSEITK